MYNILVINPGSTSTRISLFKGDSEDTLKETTFKNIQHPAESLRDLKDSADQVELRKEAINNFLNKHRFEPIHLIAARGGLVRPIAAGSYRINERMIDDLKNNRYGSHESNLGALIAARLGLLFNCPSLIADPVGVDEFQPLARYSGFPGMQRLSQSHALNIRATARRAARNMGCSFEALRLIIAHLGGGVSIAPLLHGKIIDVNNANDGGPFSPQRTGSLPTTQLVDLAFSGKYRDARELKAILTKKSGLLGYLGTDDGRDVLRRIEQGDSQAEEVYRAMAYQIAKEIGAMATVLKGRVDAIVLTGGLAHPPLTSWIEERTGWIAPNRTYPGENEMPALAEAGLRILTGKERLKEY
ncbi:putative butyrate kinase 2 [subsurface metagenome]